MCYCLVVKCYIWRIRPKAHIIIFGILWKRNLMIKEQTLTLTLTLTFADTCSIKNGDYDIYKKHIQIDNRRKLVKKFILMWISWLLCIFNKSYGIL
jgi:hypothetical protein